MADLPRIGNELVTTPQIRSAVGPDDITRRYRPLAAGLAALGQQLEEAGLPAQEAAGYASVMRNGDGTLVADLKPELGAGQRAYNAGVKSALLAQINGVVVAGLSNLRAKFPGDPEGFRVAAEGYKAGIVKQFHPELSATIGEAVDRYALVEERGIVSDKFERDRRVSADRIDARTQFLLGEMGDLARQGLTKSAEYVEAHNELMGLIDQKVANPLFAYSKERADLDKADYEERLVTETVTGELVRVYGTKGWTAARERAQAIYDDDSLGIDQGTRYKAVQGALKEVRTLFEADAQSKRDFAVTRDFVISGLKDGSIDPADPMIAAALEAAPDEFSRYQITSAAGIGATLGLRGLSLHDMLGAVKQLRVPTSPPVAAPAPAEPVFITPGAGETFEGRLKDPGNIDLAGRVFLLGPDGAVAGTTFEAPWAGGGKVVVLVPSTGPDGKALTEREAIRQYIDTHQHLGAFDSQASADEYARALGRDATKRKAAAAAKPKAVTVRPDLIFPVGGTMAGKGFIDVPHSGGSAGSRDFGGRRGSGKLHTAVDIPAAVGDPVFGVMDGGVVTRADVTRGGYGLVVDVRYPDGTVHRMAHLSGFKVKVGDKVNRGDVIGVAGHSGNASADFVHVHYETIKGGYYEKLAGRPPGRATTTVELEGGRLDPRKYFAGELGPSPAPDAGGGFMLVTAGREGGARLKGLYAAQRKVVTEGLRTALPRVTSTFDQGGFLDDGQKSDLIEGARIADDYDLYAQVETALTRSAVNEALAGIPVADQGAYIDALRAPGPTGEEAARVSALEQAIATHDRAAALLRTDPRALGVELGVVKADAPIDWTAKDAVARLRRRVPEMEIVAHVEKSGPLTVLSPGELDALGGAWATGDASAKLGLVATLASALPPATMKATLAGLAAKPDTVLLAVAGSLQSTNPEAALAVIRGAAALDSDPHFAFDEGNDYLAGRDAVFPTTALAPGADAAWKGVTTAARAVYADSSARAGDSSGKFKPDRWQAAVAMITGGVLEHNGGKIVAPAPGMGQNEFDDLIASLPAAAIGGAVSPDGTKVTIADLLDIAILRSRGDGLYQIELGAGQNIYAQRAARDGEGGFGGPFILNLRPYLSGNPAVSRPLTTLERGALPDLSGALR